MCHGACATMTCLAPPAIAGYCLERTNMLETFIMETKQAQVTIIGAGPGGYVAAIRAAQLGLKTVLVELEQDKVGGVCLNSGCVPTKCLLHTVKTVEALEKQKDRGVIVEGSVGIDLGAAMARSQDVIARLRKGIAFLLKKKKIEIIYGRGKLLAPGKVEVEGLCTIESQHVILAAGGKPKTVPFAPFDGKAVLSTTDALRLEQPPASAVIIGAGAAGMEMGLIWNACGSSVTIIEMLDHVLPFADEDAARVIAKTFRKKKIKCMAKTAVTSLEKSGSTVRLGYRGAGGEGEIEADAVLVTAGTAPNIEGLWSENMDIELDKGFVKTDEAMQTSIPNVYAIGDLKGPPLLAHAASHEGIIAAESIAGQGAGNEGYNAGSVPAVVYVHPQVAQVGLTEKQAADRGIDIAVGRFPFAAVSMAVASDETEGFVKTIAEKKTGKIIGAHIVGHEAGELISQMAAAVRAGMKAGDFINTIHPHPTLSEAMHESCLDILGRAIHKL